MHMPFCWFCLEVAHIILQGTRNSGKSLKGKNIANPVGLLLASCDMLDYLGYVNILVKGKNIANPVGLLLASCDMLDYLEYVNILVNL